MRRKALAMVLSAKAADGMMVLVDKIEFDAPKTKIMAQMLEAIKKVNENFKNGKILVALPGFEKNAILSGRNISGAETIEAAKLNTLDLLNAKCLLLPASAVKWWKKLSVAARITRAAAKNGEAREIRGCPQDRQGCQKIIFTFHFHF